MARTATLDKITTFIPSEANTSRYYGVKSINGAIGFIIKMPGLEERYLLYWANGLTSGNSSCSNKQLDSLIEFLVKETYTVLEFNHAHEFYTWLAGTVNKNL